MFLRSSEAVLFVTLDLCWSCPVDASGISGGAATAAAGPISGQPDADHRFVLQQQPARREARLDQLPRGAAAIRRYTAVHRSKNDNLCGFVKLLLNYVLYKLVKLQYEAFCSF